ncbi:TPA: conjugative transfer ATPase [Mannheimia haemolytica]|nr:conjugative transfer ATPase [Mannheimia haemolytica]ASW36634.1 conjugative transfer ATPase [Mannheimia haemolytica]ASW66456.1 conjugative transfer ATPase [Mannheimia haemolytica]ASW71729.1 conjugative transfer ATPase [Mannheimia haemolytica]KYL10485.1 type VI secretion protein [Mannheimia haemolytica]MDW0801058.1 conjugative transfer ATPase [Mannheimia haemolytica]
MSFLSEVFSSFKPTKAGVISSEPNENTGESDIIQNKMSEVNNEVQQLKRSGKLTQSQHHRRLYSQEPSFIDHLPWGEYLNEHGVILLDDARSVGAVFDIKPIGTAGRSIEFLSRIRNLVKDALQDSFDELDINPYVVQFYCQDSDDLQPYIEQLRNYISPIAQNSAFSEEWLRVQAKHFKDIGKPEGLFIDDRVTNTAWSGRIRSTKMVIYRYVDKSNDSNENLIIEQLNNACSRINGALTTAGLQLQRLDGEQIRQWLLRWFNPNPSINFEGLSNNDCYHLFGKQTSNDGLPELAFNDFSEDLFYSQPKNEGNYWYFDDQPHEVVVVNNLRKQPEVGLMTGEITRGRNINALFDLLPESTIMAITIVIHPQDKLEAHLEKISSRAVGENFESKYLKEDCQTVQSYLKEGHKLYQAAIAFYVRGKDEKELRTRSRQLRTILLSNNLEPVKENAEIAPLNSYLRWLPMNFNPQMDAKSHYYTKYYFVQHLANLLPIFGRDTGTGNPGITYFNRGGAPFNFDPFNRKDRTKNAHKLLLGPTGSGKSATLCGQLCQAMAVYRPRTFVVEAGNSFGLLADYAERFGLTVNRITLAPNSGIVLPLFSEAHRLLDMELNPEDVPEDIEDNDDTDDEGDMQRDLLAEMELTARLMITGGEKKEDEKMSRADRAAIRRAILNAARQTKSEGRQTLTEDIKNALEALSHDEHTREERRTRLAEMAESLEMFCTGVNGQFFNREGAIWPEADLTLVDLAMFAREGYEAELAISYISLINHINSLGEKYQHSDRMILNVTDESHIITANPLLAKFLVKGSKMWRKLGIWLWLATQNMDDFPNEAAKLLSMVEWWELLNVSASEIDEINRFRKLSEAQKTMLLSAKKSDRKYTEGVVLATNMEALFRVVPPSLFLALGMTEKHEKAERKQLMMQHGYTELDAALEVAARIDKARGIH